MAVDMFSNQSTTATLGPREADAQTKRAVGRVVSGLAIEAGLDPHDAETVSIVRDVMQSLGLIEKDEKIAS